MFWKSQAPNMILLVDGKHFGFQRKFSKDRMTFNWSKTFRSQIRPFYLLSLSSSLNVFTFSLKTFWNRSRNSPSCYCFTTLSFCQGTPELNRAVVNVRSTCAFFKNLFSRTSQSVCDENQQFFLVITLITHLWWLHLGHSNNSDSKIVFI